MHRTYVRKIERGQGGAPPLTVIGALADSLDTLISSIFEKVELAFNVEV